MLIDGPLIDDVVDEVDADDAEHADAETEQFFGGEA